MCQIGELIERFKSNAEFERQHGSLQACFEFRKLAELLEKLDKIEQIYDAYSLFSLEGEAEKAMKNIGEILKGIE